MPSDLKATNPDAIEATATTPLCCLCADGGQESVYYAEPTKQVSDPFHDGDLSKTMSACTTATASRGSSVFSSSNASSIALEQSLCPVTGVYANTSDDYYIFPNAIGKGHYGIVRECMHRATGRTFAIKSIDKSKIGRLDHLQREVYLLANVDHKGVMKMVDCYEDAECVHIITEKYTGGELFDKIVENTNDYGCFTERKAAGIIKGLLEAVAYLHDNGVVHRDIKPENILFEDENEENIKLIDFGLSRRHEKGDAPMSNAVGTAYYQSPELLKGRYDKSCDLWAVGIVAYIMLCGYPPFNGSTDDEIQASTRRGKLRFFGTPWLNKSEDAIDFVNCLLRRDPKKRFTAVEAMDHPWIRRNVMTSL